MLVPIFTLKLNQKILPRLVSVGSYDGTHPCLTAATNGGKVFVHTPHRRANLPSTIVGGAIGHQSRMRAVPSSDSDINLLTFGQHITSLTAGRLDKSQNQDILFIGSQTNLLAYDVENNSELYYKDLPDGANAILIGQISDTAETLAYVGGNCAILGFDAEGQDKFWTVTGDNVCSMALADYNMDGSKELLVGSEDYEIRIFKGDELLTELTESEAVISLCSIRDDKFAYSVINGEVGVYGGSERFWRIKSKSQPMCLHSFDMNADGVPELAIGWSSGKVDIRSIQTGNVIYKDTFSTHIAGIVQADYRLDGREELICCSVDGEVRGYVPPSLTEARVNATGGEQHGELEQLHKRKQELLLQLKNYDVNEKVAGGSKTPVDVPVGAIPAGTLIRTRYDAFMPLGAGDSDKAQVELTIETNNDTIIRAVVIFAECLFEGESHVVHPPSNKLSNTIKVPLFPEKNTPIDLNIKAYVGHPSSTQFHVFEACRPLPRFALFIPCGLDVEPVPKSSVTFYLSERLDRVVAWIKDSFLYDPEDEEAVTSSKLRVAYMALRSNSLLIISMDPAESGKTMIQTDDMDLAGDIIQSLALFFSIEDLSVVADFPQQMEDLKTVLTQVDELHKVRQQLTAEMADNSGVIGNLVVRAEDARMMNHIGNMQKAYSQLYNLNKDLMTGYRIRSNNHMQLLEGLKIVNQAIQRAGRLRVGKAKSRVIAACREALKRSDKEELLRVMKHGAEA